MSRTAMPAGSAGAAAILLSLGAFLIAGTSIDFSAELSVYDQKRLLQLLLYLALSTILILDRDARSGWLRGFLNWPLAVRIGIAAGAAAGCLSAALAPRPEYAFAEVGLLLSIPACALLLRHAVLTLRERGTGILLVLIALSSGLYLLRFFAGYASAMASDMPVFAPELYSNFSHLRLFSQWQSWTLALIVLPAMLLPRNRWRIVLLLLAPAWWALHFGSGTRGTSVGLIAAAGAVLLIHGRHAFPWLRAQALAAVGGLALYALLFLLPDTAGDNFGMGRLASGSDSGRLDLLQGAWDMIRFAPLLGVGPQHFAWYSPGIAMHPHNAVAQIAAEWGVPVAVTLAALILYAATRWWHHCRQQASDSNQAGQLLRVALSAAAITAGVHALFSGLLVMPLAQVCMVMVLGWMLAEVAVRNKAAEAIEDKVPTVGAAHAGVIAGALAIVAMWLPVLVQDLPQLSSRNDAYREQTRQRLKPRLWHQGDIREPWQARRIPVSTRAVGDEPAAATEHER